VSDAELLAAAAAARERAYAPYSRFAVGAALLCDNVENASYGMTMCAERTAVFAAVANGRTGFRTIAVAGPPGVTTPPCGACRQVLAEFGRDVRVLYTSAAGHEATTVGELLPATFVLP
jgi:cytidine deaminase